MIGGLSALTSLLYFLPFILRFALVWAWNLILFILWIALFGIFGKVSPHLPPPVSCDRADGPCVCRCTSTRIPRATATSNG